MNILIPALLVALLSGCAANGPAADPVRQEVLADMAQARAEGSFPVTEKQFTYPNWPGLAGRTAAR